MRRILTLVLALALFVPVVASASSEQLIADCAKDEKLDKKYSQKEYKDALKDLGADSDQYTNCRDVISRAQQADARSSQGSGGKQGSGSGRASEDGGAAGPAGGGGSGGSGSAQPASPERAAEPPATPAEQQLLQQSQEGLNRQVLDAARQASAPGVESDAEIPTSVIVLLIAVALLAFMVGALRLTSLVRSRRTA